jgi:hypothetical protein
MKLKTLVIAAFALGALGACDNSGAGSNNTDSASITTEKTNTTTKSTVEVPAPIRTSFETKYPTASDVKWAHSETTGVPVDWQWIGWRMLDDSDYVVTFNMDNSNYWVWYDDQGNWVGTVTDVSSSGLPSAINNLIQSQYANYTVTSVKKENDKNRTAYEIKLESGENKVKLLVDENGKILKKKADMDGEKTKEKPMTDSTQK